MSKGFIVARANHQSIPDTEDVPIAVTDPVQLFEVGAMGTLVDGEFVEATSPVTTMAQVTHVTLTPYGVPPTTGSFVGFGDIAGRREFPPGRGLVVVATETTFRAKIVFTNVSETFATEIPDDTGGRFAAVRGADRLWRIDFDAAGPWRYERTVMSLPGNEDDSASGLDQFTKEVEVKLVLAASEES